MTNKKKDLQSSDTLNLTFFQNCLTLTTQHLSLSVFDFAIRGLFVTKYEVCEAPTNTTFEKQRTF